MRSLDMFKRFLKGRTKVELVVFEDSQLHVARLEDIEELISSEESSQEEKEERLKQVREKVMDSSDPLALADQFAARYPDEKKVRIVRYLDLDQSLREQINQMYSGTSANIRSMHDNHLSVFRGRLREKHNYEIASSLS